MNQSQPYTLFMILLLFFFTDTAPPEIYTLSLHDALPIWGRECATPFSKPSRARSPSVTWRRCAISFPTWSGGDRKSTRLNSSHRCISYAVFCLEKKKEIYNA